MVWALLAIGEFLRPGRHQTAAAGEKREVAIPVRGSRPRIAVQMEPSI